MRSWFSARRRLNIVEQALHASPGLTNSGRLTGNPENINRCQVLSLNVSAISMITLGVEYWEQRSSEPRMINDEFRGQLTSGNGTGPGRAWPSPWKSARAKAEFEVAIFYLVVAVLLFLANQLAKHPRADGSQSDAVSNIGVDLSVDRESTPTASRSTEGQLTSFVSGSRTEETNQFSILYTPAQIAP